MSSVLAHILLVEDDPDIATWIQEVLANEPFSLHWVEASEAALAYLASGEPVDLLMTDYRLPGLLNGMELAQQAKTIRPALNVILATGFDREYLEETYGRQFTILEKPYRLKEMVSLIHQVLGLRINQP